MHYDHRARNNPYIQTHRQRKANLQMYILWSRQVTVYFSVLCAIIYKVAIIRELSKRWNMEQYVIKGGRPLEGEVTIAGAKNAALGILAAAVMTDQEVTIRTERQRYKSPSSGHSGYRRKGPLHRRAHGCYMWWNHQSEYRSLCRRRIYQKDQSILLSARRTAWQI